MRYDELNDEQKQFLAEAYLMQLADCGEYAEVVGVEWDAPSWGELLAARSIVGDGLLEEHYSGIEFVDDDFCLPDGLEEHIGTCKFIADVIG